MERGIETGKRFSCPGAAIFSEAHSMAKGPGRGRGQGHAFRDRWRDNPSAAGAGDPEAGKALGNERVKGHGARDAPRGEKRETLLYKKGRG